MSISASKHERATHGYCFKRSSTSRAIRSGREWLGAEKSWQPLAPTTCATLEIEWILSVGTVKDPRHFLLFRLRNDGRVEIGRVLHDSMDIELHLPEEYRAAPPEGDDA